MIEQIERMKVIHPEIIGLPVGQRIDYEDGGEVWTIAKQVKNGRAKKPVYTILERRIPLKIKRVGNSCLRLSQGVTGE